MSFDQIRKEFVRESFRDQLHCEHRNEHVAKIYGVDYINDSKSTNVNATWFTLECIDAPVIWIAGGVDKGNDYSIISDVVKSKVKALICLGDNYEKLLQKFSQALPAVIVAKSMEEAVQYARKFATKGDCVVLSPACASFDMFENYEDRGRQFKNAVRSI